MAKRTWEPVVVGSDAFIPLTRGKVAVVDVADLPLVRTRTWCAVSPGRSWYAQADGGPSTRLLMHRVVMGYGPADPDIDHADGDGLNNRRSNLRPASRALNGANRAPVVGGTSRFKGVSWDATNEKWIVGIKVNGRSRGLGRFTDEVAAARAYDAAALAAWGDFARLNFPEKCL